MEKMEKAVEAIGETIKEEGGDMVIKMNVSSRFFAVIRRVKE